MKHLLSIAVTLLALSPIAAHAQVGIGTTTPNAKSALDIQSPANNTGLLIPRLMAAQRMAITAPPQGLIVYQTDGTATGGSQTGFWYYAGTGGWVYLDPATGTGLTLPYSGSASTSSTAFAVSNTGTGQALSGTATGNGTAAVRGENTNPTSGSGTGILGVTVSGYGVRGTASGTNGYGVAGEATDSRGVSGISASGVGVYGRSTSGLSMQAQKGGSDLGRVAELINTNTSNDSTALYVSSVGSRPALRAVNTATSNQAALRGVKTNTNDEGAGVEGVVAGSTTGLAAGVRGLDLSSSSISSGVYGESDQGYGVRGQSFGNSGIGTQGNASGTGIGVQGVSINGIGVNGTTSNGSSTSGAVVGNNTSSGTGAVGVLGLTRSGYGVRGVASATGGYGVAGTATDSYGMIGQSSSGNGVYGSSNTSSGVVGSTGAGSGGGIAGVVGSSSNAAGLGVLGTTVGGSGVRGTSSGSGGYGVEGQASATGGVGVASFATGAATALASLTTGTGRAAFFSQANSSSSSSAVVISQSGTGLALDVTGGPIRAAEVNAPSTGGANLLPVAYGRVGRTGTILGGTGNFTVVQDLPSYGVYTITVSNLSTVDLTNAVCQVTCRYGVPGQPNAEFTATANGKPNGQVEVHVSALRTPFDLAEADFTFSIYRP